MTDKINNGTARKKLRTKTGCFTYKDARNATKSPQSATCADLLGEDVYGRHQAIYSIVVTLTIAIHGTKIGV
ncbi:hypothetical protein FOC4_g10003928 [Fusarium odoratissimum]|uniref:Uncharacterized protein n=1 Tax=Fusarium oxysporum f. sp. cubense (strain race 4) TaxID=2502994 RepID=N1RZL8_FUSC4|nr:hypothetical protein FOC4_g10003928 [Fusarium odoratissimum]